MQKLIIVLPLYTVEITGEHETEVIKQAAFWASLPTKCPYCERPLTLNYRTPKTFKYYELRCTGDKVVHSVNLGESMTNHDLYFDPKKEWYTYNVGEAPGDRNNQPTPDPALRTGTPNAALPAEKPPVPAPAPDPTSKKRNELLQMIRNCKDGGLRSGLNPADVGAMDEKELDNQLLRLGNLVLHGQREK